MNDVNAEITAENVNTEIARPVITDGIVNLESENTTITVDSVKDNGDITGITSENVKALYKYDCNKWYFGKDIGKCNLVNLANRTAEERKRLGSIGGLKAKENRDQKKTFNELAKAMLEQTATEEQIKAVLGENTSMLLDSSYGSLMLGAMLQGAVNGSFKCAEFIRDTAGYKPKNEIEVQADIMTDADRNLLENVSERIEKIG